MKILVTTDFSAISKAGLHKEISQSKVLPSKIKSVEAADSMSNNHVAALV